MNRPKLLIVDDDPEVGAFVQKVAESLGYDFSFTDSADAFRMRYRSFRPDVVILDLAMPDSDGIELLRFLAEEDCRSSVLLMSGLDASMREAALHLGTARGLRMEGSIPKPVRASTLRSLLAALDERGT